MKNQQTFAVLILAGGHSSRMKSPKPWLKLPEGHTFLEQIVNLYFDCGIREILVVLNTEFHDSARQEVIDFVQSKANILLNDQVDSGRMYSIKLGVKELNFADFVFVHNVDNPFIFPEQIIGLKENYFSKGYTKPTFRGKGGHPVLISKSIVEYILNHSGEDKTLKEILQLFPTKKIEFATPNILININTESDYKAAISEFL